MQSLKLRVLIVSSALVAMVGVLALMIASGSSGGGYTAFAGQTTPTVTPTPTATPKFVLQDSLTCSDQYLFSVSKGAPAPDIGDEPFRTGKAMVRTVVDKATNTVVESVTISYLNPNISAENPLAPPFVSATTCQEEGDGNELAAELKFTSPNPAKRGTGDPPVLVNKWQEDGVILLNDPADPGLNACTDGIDNGSDGFADTLGTGPNDQDQNLDPDPDCVAATVPALEVFGCSFSAATGEWGALSTNTILDLSTIGIDLGEGKTRSVGVLYINIEAPPGGDADLCTEADAAATAEVSFGFVSEVHARTITKGPPGAAPDDDWDGDGCSDWLELAPAPENQGLDPFNPNDCPKGGVNLTGSYNILATAFPAAKKGQMGGTLADVVSVGPKVIKDEKHVQVDLTVTDPNDLTDGQKVYWEKWVYDPTNLEDANPGNPGIEGSCDDGLDNGLTHDPVKAADGADTADTDCYDLDPDQAGWWQVKLGGIGTPSAGEKTVTLNRLFAPPCGVTTNGLLEEPAALPLDPADGRLRAVDCTGDLNLGSYFHCISRIDHTNKGTTNDLDSNIVCYIDSPLLTLVGPQTALPSFADGLAGAPPPPPYATGAPSKLNGSYDEANNKLTLRGCFRNVGGSPGPNTLVETNIDAKTLRGFANIWFKRSISECDAKEPNPANDPPSLQLAVTLARQDIDFDHDGDGCTDYQELGHDKDPITVKKCGDDPYNPLDSDADANGVVSIQITKMPADWDKKLDELIPGEYYHCIGNNISTDVNTYDTPMYCYIDIPGVDVNPQASPGESGDGLPGSGPPAPFGDIETTHSVLSTTYDKTNNRLLTTGCLEDTDGQSVDHQGNIYIESDVDAHTGQGTVNIYIDQAAGCAGSPTGDPAVADFEVAEQPPDWDSDLDGCTDAQELGDTATSGGLRDPFNRWDFMDQYTGVPLAKDRVISVGDIGAIVAKFTESGDPNGNPDEVPENLSDYHTSADRAGALQGSNVWNLKAPDGVVSVGDIGAVVGSFTHNCN